MTVLSEQGGLGHHLFDIFVDSQDSIKNLPGSFGGKTALVLNGILILFGLLFGLLKAPFNPSCMIFDLQMHSLM